MAVYRPIGGSLYYVYILKTIPVIMLFNRISYLDIEFYMVLNTVIHVSVLSVILLVVSIIDLY